MARHSRNPRSRQQNFLELDEMNSNFDVELERAVLGCLLVGAEREQIRSVLADGTAFYVMQNKRVYSAICKILDSGCEPDTLVVARETGLSAGEIAELVALPESYLAGATYARRVRELWLRREVEAAASRAVVDAHKANGDDIISAATAQLAELNALRHGDGGMDNRAVVADVWRKAETYVNHPVHVGEPRWTGTGFIDLDALLGGLRPGLHVVLGDTHVGKTWFALNTAANIAESGHQVAYFSLEMSASALVERIILSRLRLSVLEYERGRFDYAAFTEVSSQVADWPLHWYDNTVDLDAIVAEIDAMPGAPAVFVDYLGLISAPRAETRNEALGYITRTLHQVSMKRGVPVVLLHQVSNKLLATRANRRPTLSDGYESGHIAQDADVVLSIYRERVYNPATPTDIMEVAVLKDRYGGRAGVHIELLFEPTGALRNIARQEGGNGRH